MTASLGVASVSKSVAGVDVTISETAGKPLMLLVRMAARDMGIWDNVWPRLADHYSVAQFDLPAPELDNIVDPREVFSNYADLCVTVAEGLGYERFHLFGWTGGTHVVQFCMARHPERVVSAVLFEPFAELADNRITEKLVDMMGLLLDTPDIETYTYFWLMGGLTQDFLLTRFDELEEFVERRIEADKGRISTKWCFEWIKIVLQQYITDEELAAIPTPVLVVAPAIDRRPSVPMARRLTDLIPNADMAVVPDSGPLILWENPEPFMRVAEPFLRTQAER